MSQGADYIAEIIVGDPILAPALETTGFPADKAMVNLAKYGNTSAASVPIALDEAMREGRGKPGNTVLLVAFGGGLTWGVGDHHALGGSVTTRGAVV